MRDDIKTLKNSQRLSGTRKDSERFRKTPKDSERLRNFISGEELFLIQKIHKCIIVDERARSNKVYEGIGIYTMINGEDRGKKKKKKLRERRERHKEKNEGDRSNYSFRPGGASVAQRPIPPVEARQQELSTDDDGGGGGGGGTGRE
ncbi:hypothetical protein PV325_002923 [Microctonus aethiopoides]|nr:hypothetical protein PV325_002923 [Microctonus aethiopoides]